MHKIINILNAAYLKISLHWHYI